jgi:diguanylate cyclase (GGDEF)-like protein/PAS domain S-box-containing protein
VVPPRDDKDGRSKRNRVSDLSLLDDLTSTLRLSGDQESGLHSFLERLAPAVRCDMTAIILTKIEEGVSTYRCVAATGLSDEDLDTVTLPDGLATQLIKSPQEVRRVADDAGGLTFNDIFHSMSATFEYGLVYGLHTGAHVYGITARQAAYTVDHIRLYQRLAESEKRFSLAVRGTNDGLWDWNLVTQKVYYSPRWYRMLGSYVLATQESIDLWLSRVHNDDIAMVREALDKHIKERTRQFECEYRIQHEDGEYRWMLNRARAVWDDNDRAVRVVGSQTDITDRKEAEARVLHEALHDGLTQLPNRTQYMQELSGLMTRALEADSSKAFAVMTLNLERLKSVNDAMGYLAGDQLLVSVADRLKSTVGIQNLVARLNGDEFAVLLRDVPSVDDAANMACRIHTDLAVPFQLQSREMPMAASIGICHSSSPHAVAEDMLRDSHTAMYYAKAQGSARHQVFDAAMHERAVQRLQMEADLRQAIKNGDLSLHYQPIISFKTGGIAGFEALVRWDHPDRGFVSAADFIPLAEDTGLVVPLGEFVLHEACRQAREWELNFSNGTRYGVNVNLAPQQFSDGSIVDLIRDTIRETSLSPELINFEITERSLLDEHRNNSEIIEEIKALGPAVYIDDFGTGYSSLNYLIRFGVDGLKLDRSFVTGLDKDAEQQQVVGAVLDLAHTLGLGVTAEGIEHDSEREVLSDLNCDFAQGYFFARPMSAEKATELLVKGG